MTSPVATNDDHDPGESREGKNPAEGTSRSRWLFLIGLAVLAIGVVGWYSLRKQSKVAEKTLQNADLPPRQPRALPESPFLNTRNANYVGSVRCKECHEDAYESFRQSGMGRASQSVIASEEPPDGLVNHRLSQRRYEIRRRNGVLWHRELLVSGGRSVLLAEHEVTYRIGSGRHARSYLCEIDGFLVQSPVTWYNSIPAWAMSPGYDEPNQSGFERAVSQTCLRCHVGRSEAEHESHHRMAIREDWISCERCHGPGSLHVAFQEGSWTGPDEESRSDQRDYTTVNPVHLDRGLAMDVCSQCHEHPLVSVATPDRRVDDFRPGLPLDAFRATFRHRTEDAGAMTVVGHVGQLRLSRCYQSSEMSCVTCHNPHEMTPLAKRRDRYRSICLKCHQAGDCGITQEDSRRRNADDNCLQCHMPNSSTDIPHVAFTHHRIGIHDTDRQPKPSGMEPELSEPLELFPESDLSAFTKEEQAALLGAAYDEYALRGAGSKFAEVYQARAYRLLRQAWEEQCIDGEMSGRLAYLAFNSKDPKSLEFAEHALRTDHPVAASAEARINALLVQLFLHLTKNRVDEAAEICRELTEMRRNSMDWDLLAQIEWSRRRMDSSINALEQAVTINPMRTDLRLRLIEYYGRVGNEDRLRFHRERLPPPQTPSYDSR